MKMNKLKPFLVIIGGGKDERYGAAVVIAHNEGDARYVLAEDEDLVREFPEVAQAGMVASEIKRGASTVKCVQRGCLTWKL